MSFIIKSRPDLSPINTPLLVAAGIAASVLRLDAVHPIVSGNKWYKLKMYLAAAKAHGINKVVTFGGAFSNHLVATSAACAAAGLQAFGVVRGEAPATISPSLKDAKRYGMQLYFTSREAYRSKEIPETLHQHLTPGDHIVIDEGGYGKEGMLGAATILNETEYQNFSHILCAVGTGTTLAGLVYSALPHQQVIGISVLKNHTQLEAEVRNLLPPDKHASFQILHEFHHGGYAKKTPELLEHMNDWFRATGIASDFVYTGKLFFAFNRLCAAGYFPAGSQVLLVHSGGLQGNRSLPPGTLIF